MNAAALAESATTETVPPPGLSAAVRALWFAKAGRWHEAHDLCQEVPGRDGAWIHAWLHREEGDVGNAGYWYRQAGRALPPAGTTLSDEWLAIATEICGGNQPRNVR